MTVRFRPHQRAQRPGVSRRHLTIRQGTNCGLAQTTRSTGPRHLEMDLTTRQWSLLSPLVAPDHLLKRRGRPHQDARAVLNGVFWVLRTGARWADLPSRYPPHQTCHRRFQEWLGNGVLGACFKLLAQDLAQSLGKPDPDDETRAELPEDHGAGRARPGPLEGAPRLVPHGPRSWKGHTASLLQCGLARQSLSEGSQDVGPIVITR